VKSVNKML